MGEEFVPSAPVAIAAFTCDLAPPGTRADIARMTLDVTKAHVALPDEERLRCHRRLGVTNFFGRRAEAVENNENVRFT
jgi:hypothetical protein